MKTKVEFPKAVSKNYPKLMYDPEDNFIILAESINAITGEIAGTVLA